MKNPFGRLQHAQFWNFVKYIDELMNFRKSWNVNIYSFIFTCYFNLTLWKIQHNKRGTQPNIFQSKLIPQIDQKRSWKIEMFRCKKDMFIFSRI